jgi:hypothetical protein
MTYPILQPELGHLGSMNFSRAVDLYLRDMRRLSAPVEN